MNKRFLKQYLITYKRIEKYINNTLLISQLDEEEYQEIIRLTDDFIKYSNIVKKENLISKRKINNMLKAVKEFKQSAFLSRVNWDIFI